MFLCDHPYPLFSWLMEGIPRQWTSQQRREALQLPTEPHTNDSRMCLWMVEGDMEVITEEIGSWHLKGSHYFQQLLCPAQSVCVARWGFFGCLVAGHWGACRNYCTWYSNSWERTTICCEMGPYSILFWAEWWVLSVLSRFTSVSIVGFFARLALRHKHNHERVNHAFIATTR